MINQNKTWIFIHSERIMIQTPRFIVPLPWACQEKVSSLIDRSSSRVRENNNLSALNSLELFAQSSPSTAVSAY